MVAAGEARRVRFINKSQTRRIGVKLEEASGTKWRKPPDKNYSGGTLRFVKRIFLVDHEHHRTPRKDPSTAPEEGRRAPQLRQGRRGCARGIRRAWQCDVAGGDRTAGRGRDRDAVPQLPQSTSPARGGLCRRGREPRPLVGGVRNPAAVERLCG